MNGEGTQDRDGNTRITTIIQNDEHMMSTNTKEIDDVKAFIDGGDLVKNLTSCSAKAADNLKRLTDLLDENKKAQQNAQNINVAAIFKEELDNMNDLVFDSFMDLNTSIEEVINKFFPKENPAVTKFMETEKIKISKLQRELAKTSNKLKERSVQLEQLDKINQDILPNLIASGKGLNDLITATIAKVETGLKELKVKINHLESQLQKEAAMNKEEREKLRGDVQRKEAEIASLREQTSRIDQQSGEMSQTVRDLKRALAERDDAMEVLKSKLETGERTISGFQRDVSEKDAEITTLKRELADKNAAVENSKEEISHAEARADELKHAVEEKERIIEELKRGLEDTRGLAQQAQALGEMKALSEKQAEKLEELNKSLEALRMEKSAYEAKCKEVEHARDMALKELDVELARNKDLKIVSDGQAVEVSKLKERIAGLDEELDKGARIADDLSRCNEKLRLLVADADKSGELRSMLDKRTTELDECKARVDSLDKENAAKVGIIGGLQQQGESLAAKLKQQEESKLEAEKQAAQAKELNEQLSSEIKALNGQVDGMKDSLVAKDTTIEGLKQALATLKELQAKPRPLESMKDAIKQRTDELKATMAMKQDGELKGKYEALQAEMKQLLKFLEKSPKQQLLFIISNLGETSLDKLVEASKFDEGLVRNILDDLSEEKLIDVTPDSVDATKLAVRIINKLNPITYLDIKHAGLSLDFTTRPFDQVFESQLDLVRTFQEFDPETAGYILAVLYTHARERNNFTLLRQLGSYIEALKPRSFYLRLVDNLFSANPAESQSEVIPNATATMPRLIKFDTSSKELQESGEGYPKQAPFTVEKVYCISVIEEVERPDISGKARSFNSVSSLINWTWLAAKGSKIKVTIKDGSGKFFDIIVAPGQPRNAEMLAKSFKSEAE